MNTKNLKELKDFVEKQINLNRTILKAELFGYEEIGLKYEVLEDYNLEELVEFVVYILNIMDNLDLEAIKMYVDYLIKKKVD